MIWAERALGAPDICIVSQRRAKAAPIVNLEDELVRWLANRLVLPVSRAEGILVRVHCPNSILGVAKAAEMQSKSATLGWTPLIRACTG